MLMWWPFHRHHKPKPKPKAPENFFCVPKVGGVEFEPLPCEPIDLNCTDTGHEPKSNRCTKMS
jgi:hypothetical protein